MEKQQLIKQCEELNNELRRLKQRESETQKNFNSKMSKIKHERDQFAADAAALQVEYKNLVEQVECGMAAVASQTMEVQAKKFQKQQAEYESIIRQKVKHTNAILVVVYCNWRLNFDATTGGVCDRKGT